MTQITNILAAIGPGDEPRASVPLWAVFDPGWYRERYREAVIGMTGSLPDDRGLYEFWLRDGARYAHSPNRYFDEIWYRRAHLDVENGIRMGVFDSGFQHYCETGHRGRSCHWLFSESNYFGLNPDLTPALVRQMGYANGYDHYLSIGQQERRVSSAFFVPDVLRTEIFQRRLPHDLGEGEFSRVLLGPDVTALRTSWYFDPVWYLEQYPAVSTLIAQKEYASALHHYLSNEDPTAFCPNPYFDEAFYLTRYDDVNEQVRARALRNGYEHFVHHGVFEGRSPCETISLPPLCRDGDMPGWRDICDNAFVQIVKQAGETGESEPFELPSLRALAALQAMRGETLMPLVSRTPLDFRYVGPPRLSVIINAPDTFLDLVQTLASLHSANCGSMQVILLSGHARDETANINRYAYGVEVIASGKLNLQGGWLRAGLAIAAPKVLLIDSGTTLFAGALEAAMMRLEQTDVIAVAPQVLGLDLRVVEAGLSVTRDGHCIAYGEGAEAFSPGVDFVRPCDGAGGGALLCRSDALRAVPVPDDALVKLRIATHIWAALSLSLRQTLRTGQIRYDPDFLISVAPREPAGTTLAAQETLVLRRHFAEVLRGNLPHRPADPGVLHKPARWGQRILVIKRAIPAEQFAQRARLHSLCRNLVAYRQQVTVFALDEHSLRTDRGRAMLPDEVEYLRGGVDELGQLFEQRPRGFDRIWIMGGHTLNMIFDLCNEKAALLPEEGLILDLRWLEAVEARCDARKVQAVPEANDSDGCIDLFAIEAGNAWFCQDIVVADAIQAGILGEVGVTGVTILGDDLPSQESPDFDRRHDLLFAAQPALVAGYSAAFLKWFVRSVMTRLNGRLSEPVRLILACETTQSYELAMITHHQNVAPLLAGQSDFQDLAAQCRLIVAPDICEGQVAYERMSAGACGLPAVTGGNQPLAGAQIAALDPDAFAEAIVTLYQDRKTWQRLSDEARQQARVMTTVYRETLASLLRQSLVKEEMRD
ncbi:glycosyltransferase [Asaia bogorensis]|uniref:glycosyltransferase n=1 Tax=Asaia bogorensis TaxID=91915 RepID=UPI000EFAD9A2|nr:glycosyltransferase [Asaia bogorensis]